MGNSTRSKIILLGEDDADDRQLFGEAISGINSDLSVHYAENGSEALNVLQSLNEKPDIIFLDVNMPVMNGWQCLKMVKADDRYQHIPVVVYSSSTHQREKTIAMELGALDFFSKPPDFYQLREKLRTFITRFNLDPA